MDSRVLKSVTANSCGIRQCAGVDWVVLVDEQGVEQLVVAGDAVDLAKCQVLVIQGVVVGVLQLVEQLPGGGCRGDVARAPARC